MSNPTSNFGWQMPTPTDLVTDLPADFEVFGQAVDSSMADLKGGTTGQILSKATNTDMDFVWITNDQGDITGITATSPLTGGGTSGAVTVGIQSASTSQSGAVQLSDSTSTTSSVLASTPTATKSAYDLAAAATPKSTFTAKGSIAAATAASTPANLSVGEDYGFLQALASESTGLSWNSGEWTDFTTVVTAGTGSITSYTENAKYIRIGKICIFRFQIIITNAGTGASFLSISLPFTVKNNAGTPVGAGREDALTGKMLQIQSIINSTSARVYNYDNSTVIATNAQCVGLLVYEVA